MSKIDPNVAREIRRDFKSMPYHKVLGIELTSKRLVRGEAELSMRITEDLVAFQKRRYVHGGAIASIIDAAMGAACSTVLDLEKTKKIVTVEMKVNYLKPVKVVSKGLIVANAKVINESTTIIMSEATVTNEGGRPVAKALGTYTILREGRFG